MIKIRFKNLERSDIAREIARERIETIIDKFPDLRSSAVTVTLEMQNSPLQAGPDIFSVKFQVSGGRYRGAIVKKSAGSLYEALAEVVEHLLEKLNRLGDRKRVRSVSLARQLARSASQLDAC
jgi:ribosome-associated translation inhibitor RaiA